MTEGHIALLKTTAQMTMYVSLGLYHTNAHGEICFGRKTHNTALTIQYGFSLFYESQTTSIILLTI